MSQTTRREFLERTGKTGLAAATGAMIAARARPARAFAANDKLALAVIGIRGRGRAHIAGFAGRDDCDVVCLCDVDSQYFPDCSKIVEEANGRTPKTATDLRRVLDDPSIDAVVIATPDHWHAPATIWACQAGKDVYVEKPCSNNIWEGRKMVEAARKHQRIVQVGTQNRSAPYNLKAKDYLDSGKLGRIELVRVHNQKPMSNFASSDQAPPSTLDWDMWNGPAPEQPYNHTMHSNWHSFWRYGGGEVTNDAVHQFDLARWLVDVDYPRSVYTVGRPFADPGACEAPDSVITTFDFGKLTMTLDQTLYAPYMLKIDPEVRNGDLFPLWQHTGTRIEIYGTEGVMFVGRHGGGWQVFGRPVNRQPVIVAQEFGRFPDPWHHENFAECVRSRSTPTADIEEGHRTALACHAANISYRIGNRLLTLDRDTERFVDDDEANALLKYEYRAPFTIPEQV